VHPLEPAKGWAIEIKGSGSDTVFVGGSLVVKKLGDLEDPTQGIVPIEVRDVQLNGVTTLWVEWLVGSGDCTGRQPCLPTQNASRTGKKWLLLIGKWWCVKWYGLPLETAGRSDQCYEQREQEGDAGLVSRTKTSSQRKLMKFLSTLFIIAQRLYTQFCNYINGTLMVLTE